MISERRRIPLPLRSRFLDFISAIPSRAAEALAAPSAHDFLERIVVDFISQFQLQAVHKLPKASVRSLQPIQNDYFGYQGSGT
jgi:hypothetical protein